MSLYCRRVPPGCLPRSLSWPRVSRAKAAPIGHSWTAREFLHCLSGLCLWVIFEWHQAPTAQGDASLVHDEGAPHMHKPEQQAQALTMVG